MPQSNPYPLRIDKIIFEKFKIVAKENSRSINKEIEALMKEAIKAHEAANGEIVLPEQSSQDE